MTLQLNQNIFSNIPIEYVVPKRTDLIIVSDFFISDLSGGAELTLDAILSEKPKDLKICKLHSSSLTENLVLKNKDKVWLFGNYSAVPHEILCLFKDQSIKYSIIEFDFKICKFRSFNCHFLCTTKSCDCVDSEHGKIIENFCLGSKKMFWMSQRQKNIFLEKVPSLENIQHCVQGSSFSGDTIDFLKNIRKTSKINKTCVLGGGSWIKGVPETVSYLKFKNIEFDQLPNMEYKLFLEKLSNYESLTFMPLDYDTAPRVCLEAAFLGCKLHLNDNVLIKDEEWLTCDHPEKLEQFLRERPSSFWKDFQLISS